MSTVVCGTLRLTNGQAPSIFDDLSGTAKVGNVDVAYRCTIFGGHIVVEYTGGLQEEEIDEVFRVTRHLVDNRVLCRVLIEGIGLSYTLEYCRKPPGEIILAAPDQAPQVEELEADVKTFFNLMGSKADLRYAIRDFNQGLIDRESCPFLFYRAIETCARVVSGTAGKLTSEAWKGFHSKIGTGRGDMKLLEEFDDKHRHGIHEYFTREQHLSMMWTARHFLLKTVSYLLRQESIEK